MAEWRYPRAPLFRRVSRRLHAYTLHPGGHRSLSVHRLECARGWTMIDSTMLPLAFEGELAGRVWNNGSRRGYRSSRTGRVQPCIEAIPSRLLFDRDPCIPRENKSQPLLTSEPPREQKRRKMESRVLTCAQRPTSLKDVYWRMSTMSSGGRLKIMLHGISRCRELSSP